VRLVRLSRVPISRRSSNGSRSETEESAGEVAAEEVAAAEGEERQDRTETRTVKMTKMQTDSGMSHDLFSCSVDAMYY
jgi:hypothetical protein